MLLTDFFYMLYVVFVQLTADKMPYINSGNCTYADNVQLNFLCDGKLTEKMWFRWGDRRVGKSEEYAVWESSKEKDAVVLVSFKKSKLFDYKTIKIDSLHYKIFGVENGKDVEIELKDGNTNCFAFGVRYVSHLRNHCLDLDYNPDDIVAFPIIHYSKPKFNWLQTSEDFVKRHV
ncbi:hypothetical protein KR215_000181 [Drosophila sulfurigaster]|nr:hypothetical protein KR215_000181 [Drosophila sulfurigaster]